MGDINARIGVPVNLSTPSVLGKYGELKTNKAGKNAVQFIIDANLMCLNNRKKVSTTQYTYHKNGDETSRSIIDVICVSKNMFREEYGTIVLPLTITGSESHYPVIADIKLSRNTFRKRKTSPRKVWNLKILTSPEKLADFITLRDQNLTAWRRSKFNIQEINEFTKTFTSCIKESANIHVKKVLIRDRFHKTRLEKKYEKLRTKINKFRCKYLLKQFRTNSDDFLKLQKMEEDLKSTKSAIKKETNNYFTKKIEFASKRNDSKQLYRLINKFQSEDKNSNLEIKCIKNKLGETKFSTKEIQTVFYDYWHDMFTNDDDQIEIEQFDLETASAGECNRICDDPISISEVKSALHSLKKGKAIGIDDIAPVFLIDETDTLLSGLQRIFNKAFFSGSFPQNWKSDRRIPLYKQKGSKTDVEKYRLIAIHSVFRKLFCTIFDKRIRSFISLDDSQNGFRKNRRCTDHAFVLRDTIKSHFAKKSQNNLHVIILDFSKAFDRCHIPTLLTKLSQKGIRGNLLRIIANMYTNAKATIQINKSLSKPFKVTRGVAQGCTLSPLFFNIYLDDLLKRFRDSGLGVPIGCTLLNSFSFADDLALIAKDKKTISKFLEIINIWCKENFFQVNMDKSGVLSTGQISLNPLSEFYLNGKALKNLKKIHYLGFDISNTGSWDESINHLSQKARGVLARYSKFFYSHEISFKLKIQVAKSIVLSLIAYGQEIISLSKTQRKKFDVVLSMTLRKIFNQYWGTSSAALRLIAGQQSIKTTRVLSRIINNLRIKNLPEDRSLKNLIEAKEWSADCYTSGKHVTDMKFLQEAVKYSSISEETLLECITNFDKIKSKSTIKKILFDSDIIHSQQSIKNRPSGSLLKFFTPDENHPLILKKGRKYETLISWMVASTNTLEDKPYQKEKEDKDKKKSNKKKTLENNSKKKKENKLPTWCRLCKFKNSIESRKHLLTDCPSTIHFITSFSEEIKLVNYSKYEEFCSLDFEDRWLWILGGGFLKNISTLTSDSYRREKSTCPFKEGPSVTQGIDKDNPQHCLDAYLEFKNIESHLPEDCFSVFTDGSVKEKRSGSGTAIYFNRKLVHEIFAPTENLTISYAELFAVYTCLHYFKNQDKHNNNKLQKRNSLTPVHIFTDSLFTQNVLCGIIKSKKHFYLIEEINNLANNLPNFSFEIHWIPSHIENTSFGFLPIRGNMKADQLANRARMTQNESESDNNFHVIRDKLLKCSASLISKINNLLISTPSPPLMARLRTTADLLLPYGIFLIVEISCDIFLCPKQTNMS